MGSNLVDFIYLLANSSLTNNVRDSFGTGKLILFNNIDSESNFTKYSSFSVVWNISQQMFWIKHDTLKDFETVTSVICL